MPFRYELVEYEENTTLNDLYKKYEDILKKHNSDNDLKKAIELEFSIFDKSVRLKIEQLHTLLDDLQLSVDKDNAEVFPDTVLNNKLQTP